MLKSNGLPRPKIRLKKFGFSSKSVPANIAKKLPSQRCSQPLFNFAHKWPTSAFTGESGYTLGFAQRIARSGSHGETRGVSDGALSLPSERSTRFGNPAWPGFKTANFAPFGSRSRVLPKNAESLRDSDAHDARRCPAGVAAPLGCVICLQLGDVAVFSLCAQYFLSVRGVGGITTLGALCVFSKRWTTACQSGYPLLVCLHPSVIRAICNLHNVANITL